MFDPFYSTFFLCRCSLLPCVLCLCLFVLYRNFSEQNLCTSKYKPTGQTTLRMKQKYILFKKHVLKQTCMNTMRCSRAFGFQTTRSEFYNGKVSTFSVQFLVSTFQSSLKSTTISTDSIHCVKRN